MSLKQHLWDKKQAITGQWIAAVHGTYPFGTIGFLRTQQNPFVNPVGERTKVAAEAFVSALLDERARTNGPSEAEQADLAAVMDEFMRVRAIQDFSAEEAVGVFFAFKQIIRQALEENPYNPGGVPAEKGCAAELLALESDIDALALMAFDSYARHRDLLADLRVKEFKRRHSQVIRRAERTLGEDLSEFK